MNGLHLRVAALLVILTVSLLSSLNARAQGPDRASPPVTQAVLNDPDPNDWLMWRGGYAQWGYSRLDQIDRDNVRQLGLAWSYAFEPGGPGSRGMQVEPVVYGGVMYVRHANERYTAHDAATGEVIWEHARELPEEITTAEGRALSVSNSPFCAESAG